LEKIGWIWVTRPKGLTGARVSKIVCGEFCLGRHSQNARAQLLVWAEVIVDSKNASWAERRAANPKKYFEEAEPYDELIIWHKGAEFHVASSDETDVAADETARGGHAERRSVQAADEGSRRGHGAGKAGPQGKGRLKDSGWVKSAKERKEEAPRDTGETPAAKGGSKFTFVGTNHEWRLVPDADRKQAVKGDAREED
jgi:hypothetical protein